MAVVGTSHKKTPKSISDFGDCFVRLNADLNQALLLDGIGNSFCLPITMFSSMVTVSTVMGSTLRPAWKDSLRAEGFVSLGRLMIRSRISWS